MGIEQGKRLRERVDDDCNADALQTALDAYALASGGRPPGTQEFVSYPPRRF